MSILTTLRTATTCPPSGLHPYIDTPDFAYDQWLTYLGATQKAIGTVTNSPAVAVIGGGASGLCAAYELMRAGCNVTVFEQASEVGGRCASDKFGTDTTDIGEMGSMRFPPTEFILNYYLETLGIVPNGLCSLPDFPDPGTLPTYVCYGGAVDTWVPGGNPPTGFGTVSAGWGSFINNGLLKGRVVELQSAPAITAALASGNIAAATGYWQAYLDVFGQKTFYTALYEIFTGASGYEIPGGTAWSLDDFDRFGALGLGSGGFGPLYPISFMDIFRLIVNELETTQKFLQPSGTLQNGIRSVPLAFAASIAVTPGSSVLTGTPIASITGNLTLGFTLTAPIGDQYGPFARVIVATTTRSMELTLNLTEYGANPYVAPDVAKAIMRTHVVSANKVAALIPNFWAGNPSAIRCLQTDNLAHQVYTLDYKPAGVQPDTTGVCFISYVWDDDAVKQQSITNGLPSALGVPADASDNQLLYTYLLNSIAAIGGDVATWAQQLQPLNGDFDNNVIFEEWQSSPYFGGAFKLSEPGQDSYVQRMFFDYQKCQNPASDTGVYIAGDCISWTSGWVEGALTPALNAAAGVIASLGGTLNPDGNGNTPLTIQPNRYKYF